MYEFICKIIYEKRQLTLEKSQVFIKSVTVSLFA